MKQNIQRMWEDIYRGDGAWKEKDKKEKYRDCNPTWCWEDILTWGNEFVTLKNIKRVCDCKNKEICIEFLRTLDIKVLDQIQ